MLSDSSSSNTITMIDYRMGILEPGQRGDYILVSICCSIIPFSTQYTFGDAALAVDETCCFAMEIGSASLVLPVCRTEAPAIESLKIPQAQHPTTLEDPPPCNSGIIRI